MLGDGAVAGLRDRAHPHRAVHSARGAALDNRIGGTDSVTGGTERQGFRAWRLDGFHRASEEAGTEGKPPG